MASGRGQSHFNVNDFLQPFMKNQGLVRYPMNVNTSNDYYRDEKEAIPPNMPESSGLEVLISCFVDANHAGNVKDRRSQTGILIFINKAPIHWYSKHQATVETSTFGAEFCIMRVAADMIESLRYKL